MQTGKPCIMRSKKVERKKLNNQQQTSGHSVCWTLTPTAVMIDLTVTATYLPCQQDL